MTHNLEQDWFSRPGDSIRSLMKRKGLTLDQIASECSDGEVTLRRVISGDVKLNAAIANDLAQILGGTQRFWLDRQSLYDDSLERAVCDAAALEPEEWLDRVPDPLATKKQNESELDLHAQLRRRLSFFNVPTYRSWFEQYGKHTTETPFRESQAEKPNDSLKLLWLRRGELEADLIPTSTWNPKVLEQSIDQIRNLTKISKPARFLPKLQEILASAGVAFVVVRSPKNCFVSGATRMISEHKAMLLVSFRYRADDQFWFTVFHEIAHLILHDARTFVDDIHDSEKDVEKEANDFARDCIIPKNVFEELDGLAPRRKDILRFSTAFGVAPGLVVGQMQHAKLIRPNQLNGLKRFWNWQDINPALI